MQNTELAAALFAGFQAGDENAVRAVCAPDLEAIQNGAPAMSLDALLSFTMSVHRVVSNFRYEHPVRSATATGFVEEHTVRGSLPDGTELALAACVVGEVEDGVITVLREYVDRLAAAKLAKALADAG